MTETDTGTLHYLNTWRGGPGTLGWTPSFPVCHGAYYLRSCRGMMLTDIYLAWDVVYEWCTGNDGV